MKKVTPYNSVAEANKSLDNGGRFFNIFTKANDGKITEAELCKVAGVFYSKQEAILYLELALSKLSVAERGILFTELEEGMQAAYKEFAPVMLASSKFNSEAALGKNIIVTGTPKVVKTISDFRGFVQVPSLTGDVSSFDSTPIIDIYTVYEIKEESTGASFIIAHNINFEQLPEKPIMLGGIVKEFTVNLEEKEKASDKYLEALYYVELP